MMASPRRADIEKSLLSRLFGHVIKLGVCTIGVEPQGSEPRTEAPDPAVLARFLGWFAEQTPQRQIIGMWRNTPAWREIEKIEFLELSWPQVDRNSGGIRVFRAKQRGKKRERIVEIIAWACCWTVSRRYTSSVALIASMFS